MNRKIAAILAADVAGYSRLVAADEEGALRRLVEAQVVFKERVAAYRGRIFNTAGDAILAEFPSAVDATRAALDIQREMALRNADVAPGDQFHFRIGLNIGDVVEHEGDLLGDGVNVAARIQALAPAGGLAISHWVREHTSGKITVPFRDIGKKALKNIPAPVHVFVAELAPVSSASTAENLPTAPGSALALKLVAAGLVLLALGAAAMTQFRSPQSSTPTIAPIETVKPATPQPPASAPLEQTKAVAPEPAPLPPVTAAPVPPTTPTKAPEAKTPEIVPPKPVTIEPEKAAPRPSPPIETAVPKPLPIPMPDTTPTPAAPAPSAALPAPSIPATPPTTSPSVIAPAIDIPRPAPAPPAKSVVVQPPAIKPVPTSPTRTERELPLPERKHTCAEVLERAQLGDITPEDRAFLRTQCR